MIDHISLPVRDVNASAVFYQRVLEPLGMIELVHRPATVGFGSKYPEFWINLRPDMQLVEPGTGAHVCLRARSVEAVKAFTHEHLRTAAGTTARRARGKERWRRTMPRSYAILMATRSR